MSCFFQSKEMLPFFEFEEKEQTIVVPKFGKYRKIVSSENDMHFEQIKIESQEDVEGVQW